MSDDERVRVFKFDGKRLALEQIVPSHGSSQQAVVRWSPDGQWLAWRCANGSGIKTWNVAEQRPGPALPGGGFPGLAGWNQDGTVLASGGADRAAGTVFLWKWPSGELLQALHGHAYSVTFLEWSSDFEWLASGDSVGTVRFWKADGTPGGSFQRENIGITNMAWSPTQPLLAIQQTEPYLQLLSPDGTIGPRWDIGSGGCHMVFGWNSDGKSILANEGGNCQPCLRLDGSVLHTIPRQSSAPFCAQPQGTLVATDNQAIFELSSSTIVASLGQAMLTAFEWSADGRFLAAITAHGEMFVWDAKQRLTVAAAGVGASGRHRS